MTGKLTLVTYTEEQRRMIADAVRNARITRGLDKEPAARAVDISSITWKRVEDALGVRDASLAKILKFLRLPNAEELLRGPSSAAAPQPALPRESPQEGIVRYGTLLWDAVVGVADAAQGSGLEGLAEHAVVIAADVLPELILGLNPGPAARPLIESTVRRGPLAVERVNHFNQSNQGDTRDMEAETQSDASAEAVQDQEAALPEGVQVDDDSPLRIDEFTFPDDRHKNHQDTPELVDPPRRRRGNSKRGPDTAS